VVRKDKYVADLREEDIQLLEDGVPQKITLFEGPGSDPEGKRTVPVEIALLFDVSLSVMNFNLLDGFSIKDTLLDGLGEHVSVSVYGFGARLKRFSAPTRDIEKLKAALDGVYNFTHLGTRLYEAIIQTARDTSASPGNPTRLMIIFSDGLSTTKTKPELAASAAAALGFQLYPVILGHERLVQQSRGNQREPNPRLGSGRVWGNQPLPGTPQAEQRARAQDKESQMGDFAAIGPMTGGRSFDPPKVNNLVIRTIFQSLVKQVQAEYVAGYSPAAGKEAKRPRQVRVELRDKSMGKVFGGSRLVVH
jgi:VWFA-related protein